MTINSKKMTDLLNTAATSIDLTGFQDVWSDVFTNFKAAGESLLGKTSGQSVDGVEGLTEELTTLAQQTQTSLVPVVARIKDNLPQVEELITEISSSNATKISNMQSDSDLSAIFPLAKTVMTSSSTMLHDIITNGTPFSLGSNLASITGKTLDVFEPSMKKLADSEVQTSILKAATSLQENSAVKELTAKTSQLATSFASSTGPFNSGNFLKDLTENETYTITNSVRVLNPNLPESTFESITNKLLVSNQIGAVDEGVGNLPIPSAIQSRALTMGVPLPEKSLTGFNSFIQRMKLVAPDLTSDLGTFEADVRKMTNELVQTKADLSTAIVEDKTGSVQVVDTPEEVKKQNAFKTIRSLEEITNLFKSAQREITTVVWHWTGHYSDAYNVGASDINSEYKSVSKTIPYHLIIKRNGDIESGSSVDITTNHVPINFRPFSIGIAFVAGFNHGRPTDGTKGILSANSITRSQMESFYTVMEAFYRQYPGGDAFGKKDLDNQSSSPGFDVGDIVFEKFKKTNSCNPSVSKRFLSSNDIIATKNTDLIYVTKIGVQ